jgi:hypothetical protein
LEIFLFCYHLKNKLIAKMRGLVANHSQSQKKLHVFVAPDG